MKLSEAILLGAMLKPQGFSHGIPGKLCALEAAATAVGLHHWSYVDLRWAWLRRQHGGCPESSCARLGGRNIFELCYHLNDVHHWTRERIAAWIATIEPKEVAPIQVEVSPLIEVNGG